MTYSNVTRSTFNSQGPLNPEKPQKVETQRFNAETPRFDGPAGPQRVTAATTVGTYDGAELAKPPVRAGSSDAYRLPSLMNGRKVATRAR